MKVLLNEPSFSMEVKKSKFITSARHCNSLQQAKLLVKQTWDIHPDASHVVHAAVVGKSGDLFSFSDDKEPKNTAGRPALEILKGSFITDICVLVVRYFGGTLLGTGGLVQAYGDSVKGVLALCETEEMVEKSSFRIVLPYNLYEPVKKELLDAGSVIETEAFTTEVVINGSVASSACPLLEQRIRNLTKAQALVSFTAIS